MRFFNFVTTVLVKVVFVANCFAAPLATTAKIVVMVNKDAISLSDLDNRIKLITLISGLSAKPQSMEKMRGQVLLTLMQEKIQIQAAKNKKITISEQEVEQSLETMAKGNNMSYKDLLQLLASNGIPKQTLFAFITAQLAWVKYARQQFAPIVHVTDNEVDTVLQTMKEAQNNTLYQISEILLLVSSPAQESTVRQDANKLYEDLKAGANFSLMAQQFSKNAVTDSKGDLSWRTLGQIDPAISAQVTSLKTGQISKPIRTPSGFKIIKLKGMRLPGEADINESQVSFCQAFLPLTPYSSEEEMRAAKDKADQINAASNCEDFKKNLKAHEIDYQQNVDVIAGQLPDQLKELLMAAKTGKALEPLMTEQGLLLQMVCNKKVAALTPPNKEEVRAELEQQKMHQHATREMQRLRSTAAVEFKDSNFASLWK